jgi:redox-sensing transcriptional repressor
VPEGVDVRKVDLAIELQILSFHEHRKSALTTLPSVGNGRVKLPPALSGEAVAT